MCKMTHLELFSGIGGFRRALDLLTKDKVMRFSSIGYSEIDANALATYTTNFIPKGSKEISLGDIVDFTADESNIRNLPDFDLLTGGFPCQSFSMMGNQLGFNDEDRGQLFFRIIDILKIKRPRNVLLENVKNLYTHDHGNTFLRILYELKNLGYNVVSNIFDTQDFHLPQRRRRVLIFATTNPIPEDAEKLFERSGWTHVSEWLDSLPKLDRGKQSFFQFRVREDSPVADPGFPTMLLAVMASKYDVLQDGVFCTVGRSDDGLNHVVLLRK